MLARLVNDPELWRGRAEEARATGEQMTSIEAREILFRIAEHYDGLARCAEKGPLKHKKASTGSIPKARCAP